LAVEQRDAITARFINGLDYPEIAVEMQCSEQVVRKRVSRGLSALRARLAEGVDGQRSA
jgi:RNA polymerase sigma-70 factor (ECF subfamily)